MWGGTSKDESKGKTALSYFLCIYYINMSVPCRAHQSGWFYKYYCINANTVISSIPFKCTSLGTATRHPAANPSNLLCGHLYCLLSTRCFYIVVANGFYINVQLPVPPRFLELMHQEKPMDLTQPRNPFHKFDQL